MRRLRPGPQREPPTARARRAVHDFVMPAGDPNGHWFRSSSPSEGVHPQILGSGAVGKKSKRISEMRARSVLATASALLLMTAAGSPAFAKAHPQPSPVADLLGQEVSSTRDGYA